jgi:quercetin dioxygenase-like cupin family protein
LYHSVTNSTSAQIARTGGILALMALHSWDKIPKEQMNPLLARQAIHGQTMTVARIELNKGCFVPEHSHANEQISMIEKGRLKFVLAGKEIVVAEGEALQIPPHVPHSAEALEDSVAVDLFSPPREDWIRGDDAYLRSK